MSIDPKILKRMQGEDSFLQSQTKGSRRIKLERGQNMIVRFLPARFGPDGLWFARIAKHWVNKVGIVCPRMTAEDFGGSLDFDCPICALADELNDSSDEVISKFGYKAKANPQFFTYCVLFEKNGVALPLSEVLNPYEFNHYRSTWEELKGFYVAGGRGKSGDSVLDYKTGNDFSVNKGAKGMRLDKLDSAPIFELNDPKWDEKIKKLESAMKQPKVIIPTDEQLHLFARKLQEAADRGGAPADEDSPRRNRSRPVDEEADFRPRRRPAAEEDDDDLPYDDVPPARPAARATAAPRRSAPEPDDAGEVEEPSSRRRPAPADSDEPAPRRRPAEDEAAPPRRSAPAQDEDEPPARRPATAPSRRAPVVEDAEPTTPDDDGQPAEPENDPEPVDEERPAQRTAPAARGRALPPTERRQQAASGRKEPAGAVQGDPEEDDPLPEDDKDPVPPADKAERADEDAPPPVSHKGGQSQADLIKARLAKHKNA